MFDLLVEFPETFWSKRRKVIPSRKILSEFFVIRRGNAHDAGMPEELWKNSSRKIAGNPTSLPIHPISTFPMREDETSPPHFMMPSSKFHTFVIPKPHNLVSVAV